ncbi:MAG: PAS domain-containing protein, partial [Acidimicrobiia bacterium]
MAFAAERLLRDGDWREGAVDVLAGLGGATGASRVALARCGVGPDGSVQVALVEAWHAPFDPSTSPDPGRLTPPWEIPELARWTAAMPADEPIHGPVTELSAPACETLEERGVRSIAAFPASVGSERWWLVCEDLVTPRNWTEAELDALRATSAILGAAIRDQRVGEHDRATEDRYRAFVEQIPAITYTDVLRDGTASIGYISPQIEALLGYPRERFMDDPDFWFSIVHAQDRERVETAGSAITQRGVPFDLEYRMIAADGSVVWVH